MDQSAHTQSCVNSGHGLFEVTGHPRALLRPGIVSVTTVSAAFRFEGCFHCVPLPDANRTHARRRAEPRRTAPGNYTPGPPEKADRTDVVLLSLNSERGCIKVVDTFRCSRRGRSGARRPRPASAKDRAARGCGWLRSSLPLRCAPRLGWRQVGTGKQGHRSNRKAGSGAQSD